MIIYYYIIKDCLYNCITNVALCIKVITICLNLKNIINYNNIIYIYKLYI